MWIYIPQETSKFSAYALEDMAWISDWNSLCEMLEQSVLWRSKPIAKSSWLRKLKKEYSYRSLYGQTLKLLMHKSGVERWIASLADTRVNPSVLLDDKRVKKIQDIYGLTSQESSESVNLPSASLKMSEDIYDWGMNKSTMTYKQWVTKLRQACLQRRKSEHLTSESDNSSWRAVKASEPMGGCLSKAKFIERLKLKLPLSLRDQVHHLWPTITAMEIEKYRLKGSSQSATCMAAKAARGELSHLGPMTIGQELPQTLNPRFTEWMMGWPRKWTRSECTATELCHYKQHMRSLLCGMLDK